MRILILNRVEPPAPGATGRLVHELASYLSAAGHTVQTITSGKLPPKIIPYLLAWLSIGMRACFAPRADRVVVMTDPPMLGLWIPILKLRHHRVIYWCQDLYPHLLPIIGIQVPGFLLRILETMHGWAVGLANNIIAIGRCMAEKLASLGTTLHFIPNWTEQEDSPKDEIPPGPFRFLYAGNVGRIHPVDEIIHAVKSCQNLPVQFIFMVGGHGAEKFNRALSNQKNVSFLPPQPWEEANKIQSNAHVHMVGLKAESTGLAVPVKYYAALRCQRPIVFMGTNESEIARHIQENHCGNVILPSQAGDLARIIASYSDGNGNITPHWKDTAQRCARAAQQLPDSLSMLAKIIISS